MLLKPRDGVRGPTEAEVSAFGPTLAWSLLILPYEQPDYCAVLLLMGRKDDDRNFLIPSLSAKSSKENKNMFYHLSLPPSHPLSLSLTLPISPQLMNDYFHSLSVPLPLPPSLSLSVSVSRHCALHIFKGRLASSSNHSQLLEYLSLLSAFICIAKPSLTSSSCRSSLVA